MPALPQGAYVPRTKSLEVKADVENAGDMSRMWPTFRIGGGLLVWYGICELCPVLCIERGDIHRLVGAGGALDPGLSFLLLDGIEFRFSCSDATLDHAA